MWRSLPWRASASEDEIVPDAEGAGPHPRGGSSEGDDRDYDFLNRGECREEARSNVGFRRALLRQLQQHQAVRNTGEHAAWLGSPEDALQKLQDRRDPSHHWCKTCFCSRRRGCRTSPAGRLLGRRRPQCCCSSGSSSSEGDDRDYDFLNRGECREQYPGKIEFYCEERQGMSSKHVNARQISNLEWVKTDLLRPCS
jgi:hypothetical protein